MSAGNQFSRVASGQGVRASVVRYSYLAQAFRSNLSFALASAIVCHWRLETSSGPPQARGTM
jgi:hypothetical protein